MEEEDDAGNAVAEEDEEEEAEDEGKALTEAAERQSGVEEFEDKEHEAQFCLESNFMDEDGQEAPDSAAEHKDGKGRKAAGNEIQNHTNHNSANRPGNIVLHLQTCFWSIWTPSWMKRMCRR